jgi:hypothetical protein
MGLGPFGASAPLFLRNGELLGHSPIRKQHRYKAYSAGQTSTAQIRAEGNNTKCVG